MRNGLALEKCLTYINCGLQPPLPREPRRRCLKAITLSRQSGAGGHAVAELLASELQRHEPPDSVPWTVFDRNLVEKVLEDHNLPARLARFMPEDRISNVTDTMDELFGLHPPSWNLVRNVSETILRLIENGNVIIIGRGANVIAEKVEGVLHVRLIGSVERRIEHLRELHQISEHEAKELMRKEDAARARYLRAHFDKDIADPLLYHITMNTDAVTYQEAASLLAELAAGRFGEKARGLKSRELR